MQELRQSTAATVKLGPFVDAADAVTPVEDLTIQKADVRVSKNGGNMAAANADQGTSDAGAPHDEIGVYDGSLDATDTNTLGRLRIDIQMEGAAPWFREYMILTAEEWDAKYSTGIRQANVTQWRGNTPANLADTDKVPASTQHMANDVLTEAAIASEALTAAKAATDLITAIQSGLATSSSLSSVAGEVSSILAAVDAEITTILNRLGAFTGSGDNTLLGVLRALAREDADLPSDIGGTFDPATDSLEGIRNGTGTTEDLESAVQTVIEANHLDRLLAATYDPSNKPGAADALLNELVENDGGVSRFTANALEQAPSGGGGGDATEAKQDQIIALIGTPANTDMAGDLAEISGKVALEATLGSPDGASLAADIAGIISALAALPADPAIQADVESAIDALGTAVLARLPAALVSGRIAADVGSINGSESAAIRQAMAAANMVPFTVDDTAFEPTDSAFEADDVTEATANHYRDRVILWTSGALQGQVSLVDAYELSSGRGMFTVTNLRGGAMTEAPANDDTGIII